MKLSITLLFLIFSITIFGQNYKSPKNINQAIKKLDKSLYITTKEKLIEINSDSLLIWYKDSKSEFNVMKEWFYKWTRKSTTKDARLGKYYKRKGLKIPNDMIEVVLRTYQAKVQGLEINHDEILKQFQIKQQKNNEEDKVRFTTDSLRGYYIPKNLDDAINSLDGIYSDSTKIEITKLTEKEFIYGNYRPGIGLWMRNNWQLWGGSRLSKYFRDNKINHPESMSVVILKSYYRYLKNEKNRFEEQIKEYVEWEEKVKADELKRKNKE
tara:strand:+ start:515 stop:1318 length:804 start_codon:yes stop_codon:yes gene_type:complete